MIRKYKRIFVIAAAASLGIGGGCMAYAAEGPSQLDEILRELREIKKLIEKQSPPQGPVAARVNVGNAPILGSKDAPLTIVQFTDFQCAYCQQFHQQTFPDLKALYIDSGKVRFYSLDLPLDSHPNALLAAQAGQCAAEQGSFWKMHDQMQSHPDRLAPSDLAGYAQGAGVDIPRFRQCLESGKYKDEILKRIQEAKRIGALGTPAFVIGKSTPDGVEGELVIGAVPLGIFEQKMTATSDR